MRNTGMCHVANSSDMSVGSRVHARCFEIPLARRRPSVRTTFASAGSVVLIWPSTAAAPQNEDVESIDKWHRADPREEKSPMSSAACVDMSEMRGKGIDIGRSGSIRYCGDVGYISYPPFSITTDAETIEFYAHRVFKLGN
jgi:hypothetical protein